MLSDELQRFINEINSENNKSDIFTCDAIIFSIFTVCKNEFFMNFHEFWVKCLAKRSKV